MAIAPETRSLPLLLGRYAIYEKLASGGMASVHVGRLRGPVGFARTVAIKRMHGYLAENPEFVSMFYDEARLAARIRHPNVVPTLDVVTEDGELFVVMEYVPGESLAHLVRGMRERGERIPPAIVASIMAGVLHGLHAAHEARDDDGAPLGIVHRDVSPQNILVGVDGVARVLDFGVAKAAGRLHTTREGQLKGKMAYMAPEQVRAEPIDRRVDVYAASAVLWEALTGLRLFQADSDAAVLQKILEGNVAPPSKHAPDVPAALDALTLRGLRSNPGERFATAREMARAIEDCMPAVVASRIGEWVESTAAVALAERARLVEAIERDSSVRSTVAGGQGSVRDAAADAVSASEGTETDLLTPPPGASPKVVPGPASASRRRARAASVAAALGVLGVSAALATLGTIRREPVRAASQLAADAAPSAALPSALSPEPETSVTAVRSSAPVVPSAALPRVESSPRTMPVPARRGSPQPSPTPKRSNVYDHM